MVESQRKRARTEKENGNETEMYGYQVQLLTPMAPSGPYDALRSHKITSYHLTEVETKALTNFKRTLFSYTGDCHCAFDLNTTRPTSVTKGLQEYVIHSSSTLNKETQVTEVSYLRVLNRNADGPETILEVLSWLHKELQIGSAVKYLLVAGDEKTYNHMIQLKSEYGEALDLACNIPWGLHLMRIYQEVLMSAYWDTGLKQIAAASGYRGETLTSLSRCSNFTNTTAVLFEALFHHTINIFHQYKNENSKTPTQPEVYDEYSDYVSFMKSKNSGGGSH